MGRTIGAAFIALIALTIADQYLSSGRYTEAVLAMLRQMRHAFG
jgi:hypothetical protein